LGNENKRVWFGTGIDQILNGATSPNSKTASSHRKATLDLATSSSLDLPEGCCCSVVSINK